MTLVQLESEYGSVFFMRSSCGKMLLPKAAGFFMNLQNQPFRK